MKIWIGGVNGTAWLFLSTGIGRMGKIRDFCLLDLAGPAVGYIAKQSKSIFGILSDETMNRCWYRGIFYIANVFPCCYTHLGRTGGFMQS